MTFIHVIFIAAVVTVATTVWRIIAKNRRRKNINRLTSARAEQLNNKNRADIANKEEKAKKIDNMVADDSDTIDKRLDGAREKTLDYDGMAKDLWNED